MFAQSWASLVSALAGADRDGQHHGGRRQRGAAGGLSERVAPKTGVRGQRGAPGQPELASYKQKWYFLTHTETARRKSRFLHLVLSYASLLVPRFKLAKINGMSVL